ncbi:hypothetical protein CYMTET_28393, partial [Cymbomonas tetramitiformis]
DSEELQVVDVLGGADSAMPRRYQWSLRTLLSLLCGITEIASTTIEQTQAYQSCLRSTTCSDLHLYSMSLTGSIPSRMGEITSLNFLYLNENSLTGTMPTELGALTSLQDSHGGEPSEEEAASDTGDAAVMANAALHWVCCGGSCLSSAGSWGHGGEPSEEEAASDTGDAAVMANAALHWVCCGGSCWASAGGWGCARSLAGLRGVSTSSRLGSTLWASEAGGSPQGVQLWVWGWMGGPHSCLPPDPVGWSVPRPFFVLRYLDENSLTGTMPTELGALTSLPDLHGGKPSEEEAASDTGDAAVMANAALHWPFGEYILGV